MIKLAPEFQAIASALTIGKARRKYTDVGCYPLFYLVVQHGTQPGDPAPEVYCPGCCESIEDEDLTIIGAEPNWEDPALHCEACGDRIESAYAEEEADQ